ncbi:hypothetical protein [Halalkalibacter nanhaiisediminis]|uniref:Uncharacterized protein n=1 Tax=Halalkalibacter nanhaiisediminis TaxID=688079 RepID=A0A562QGJ8_9BACI|nr:hypothetical protein [Halalkalibacter nanhaiisediminis]TWI55882.1 hypothetical protein IQ10_02444 [Halalkalibacter nanhaiisediminis]
MKYHEPELKEVIKQFEQLLNRTPDKPEHVITFKIFLRQLLRVKPKQINLPAAEIIAVLKNDKPQIFRTLKLQSTDIAYLHYLTNINMDYHTANKKLTSLKESLN